MAGFLDIKQGGKIRANLVAATGETWLRGQVLAVNTSGQLQKLTTALMGSAVSFGLAMEQCVAASTGNVIQNTAVVIAGQTASVLFGEAVVVNDNLSGTGGWVAGASRVYGQNGGDLTYVAPGASINQSGLNLGVTLVAPAQNGRLTFLFRPTI